MTANKSTILTGDRPTGRLHIGHYVGSLRNRIELQHENDLYIMVANLHALTTNTDTAEQKDRIRSLVIDQISAGIDPQKATFFVQSEVPEIAELATILSMLIPESIVKGVPTLKDVLRDLKIQNPSMGLIMYPVLMAADILIVKADTVPVGKDQASHVELARELARRFNSTYGEMFPVPKSLIPEDTGTLPGTDGKAKMSKSIGNTIYLSDNAKTVETKVMDMYTDPTHVHVNDPGKVEGNTVFTYLDIFDPDKNGLNELKKQYTQGGLGDVVIKKRLAQILNDLLEPMRQKQTELEKNTDYIDSILKDGTDKVRKIATNTLREVKEKMKINFD